MSANVTAIPTDKESSPVQLVLIALNLALTFMTTAITTIKFRAKCGNSECNMRPSNAASTPEKVTAPEEAPKKKKKSKKKTEEEEEEENGEEKVQMEEV